MSADAGRSTNPDAAIFFDLDGTLVQFTRPYDEVLADTFAAHLGVTGDDLVAASSESGDDPVAVSGETGDGLIAGSGQSVDALVGVYDEAFFEAFHDFAPDPYRRGMAAVVETARADADPDAMIDADPDAMVATLREVEYETTAVDDALPEALDTLAEDAALGVLTNGVTDWQAGKLAHHGLSEYFDAVVTSYEAGAHKPDPEPFELAESRVPAAEYAMVGDEDADVEGARAAGWVPIRYEDGEGGPAFWETVGALL